MAAKVVEVLITGSSEQARAEIDKLQAKTAEASDSMGSKWKTLAQTAGLAVAGALVAVAAESVKLADEFDKSHAQLVTSIKDAGLNFDQLKPQIAAVDDQQTKFGTNAITTEGLLSKGIAATKNYATAVRILNDAQDGAAKTGKPLADIYMALIKGAEGNTRPLKQLGIDVPIATSNALAQKKAQDGLATANLKLFGTQEAINNGTLSGAKAHDALTRAQLAAYIAAGKLNAAQSGGNDILSAYEDRMKGSASAAADTFGGKMDALKAKLDNVMIKIGQELTPVLLTLANTMLSVMQSVSDNWDSIKNAVSDAWSVIQPALDSFINIGLLPIRVALDIFHGDWSGVWDDISGTIGGVVGAIVGVFNGLISTLDDIIGTAGAVESALKGIADFTGFGESSDFNTVLNKAKNQSAAASASKTAAQHGVVRKAAGGWADSGWVLRGEHGPELTYEAGNTYTVPAGATANALGGSPVVVQLVLDGQVIHESLLRRQTKVGNLGFRGAN